MRKFTLLPAQQLASTLRVFRNLKLQALMILVALVCHFSILAQTDNIANAPLITFGTYSGNNLSATSDLGCSNNSVWYKIIGTGANINVTTCGTSTNYDSYLGAFNSAQQNITCNDDACSSLMSNITFATVNGQTYYIQVGGFSSSRGNFQIKVTNLLAPASQPTISSSANNLCNPSNVTLSIAGGSLNNSANWHWYSNGCGSGTFLGTGTSIVVNVTSTTTFYARGEGGTATSFGVCGQITINVLNCDNDGDGDPNSTDCAPNNPAIYHGAAEICNNGIDDNCNGSVDENCIPATALNFDGANDNVIANNISLANTSFTIEFKAKRNGSGNYDIAIGSGSGVHAVNQAMHIGYRDNDNFTFAFYGNDLDVPGLSDNQWHHWACVYQAGTASGHNRFIYRDGILVASDRSNNFIGTSRFVIGDGAYLGNAFNGDIDEVRVWRKALCQGEIANSMNCELGSTPSDLIAYYKLNQGFVNSNNSSFTNVTDASVYGNHGTMFNFTRNGATSNWTTGVVAGTCSVYQPPTASISADGPTTFCPGGSVILTASGGSSYLWSTNETSSSITVNATGNYSVTASVQGCKSAPASINVTVEDNEAPVKPAIADATGECSVTVTAPTTTDNCAGTVTGTTNDATTYTTQGTHYINWTFNDGNGNSTTAVQKIVVNDVTPPTFITNSSSNVNFPSGGATPVSSWAPMVKYFNDPLPAGAVITGANLTYTAVDQGWGGTGAPSEMYVSDTHIGAGILQHHSTTHTLNYTGSIPGYVYGGINTLKMYFWGYPGWQAFWQGGTLTINYTYNGCNASITVNNDAGKCGAAVNVATPSAIDNCGTPTVAGVRSDALALSADYPVGTTTITWTATDANNLTSTCTQDVTVRDVQAPVIATNGDKNVSNDAGKCGASVIVSASATDNCNVGSPTGVRSDNLALTADYPVGTTTITWNVTDVNGNSATATQTVTVVDNEAPVINTNGNKSVNNDASKCGASVAVSASASDNCGVGSPSGVRSDNLALDADYPVGTTTITWNVTDVHGNPATATQTVTVTDSEKPTITAPANLNVAVNNAGCSAVVSLGTPVTGDNCSVASVTNDAPATFGNGTTTTVTWTVTDIHGNTQTATQQVSVYTTLNVTVANNSVLGVGVNANTVYNGYAPASTLSLTAAPAGGGGTYTYNWSVTSGFSVVSGTATAQTAKFVYTATGNTTGTVTLTVTDNFGCSKTITKTIYGRDVRCGNKNDKVLVCHKTGSASNPWVQICIAPAAVATHLSNGSTLGECYSAPTVRTAPKQAEIKVGEVKVYPNPTTGQFNVQLIDFARGKAQVQLMDQFGKVVATELLTISYSKQDVSFNLNRHASGTYHVRAVAADGTIVTAKVVVAR